MDMETYNNQKPAVFYYGWFILAVVFIAQMMTIGLTSYSFGLFVLPVSAEFGLSRADTNIGLMTILTGLAVGRRSWVWSWTASRLGW